MDRLYKSLAQGKAILLAALFTVAAFVAFALFDRARPAGTPSVVALQLAFSATRFREVLEQWGAPGMQAYRTSTLLVDSWFPIAYAALLSGLLARLTARLGGGGSGPGFAVFALPLLAAALDWIENVLHLSLLRDPSRISAALVLLASIAATVKWALLGVSIVAIVGLLLRGRRQ